MLLSVVTLEIVSFTFIIHTSKTSNGKSILAYEERERGVAGEESRFPVEKDLAKQNNTLHISKIANALRYFGSYFGQGTWINTFFHIVWQILAKCISMKDIIYYKNYKSPKSRISETLETNFLRKYQEIHIIKKLLNNKNVKEILVK